MACRRSRWRIGAAPARGQVWPLRHEHSTPVRSNCSQPRCLIHIQRPSRTPIAVALPFHRSGTRRNLVRCSIFAHSHRLYKRQARHSLVPAKPKRAFEVIYCSSLAPTGGCLCLARIPLRHLLHLVLDWQIADRPSCSGQVSQPTRRSGIRLAYPRRPPDHKQIPRDLSHGTRP